jgi:hypothetical protein
MQEFVSCVVVVLLAAALGLGTSSDDGAAGMPPLAASSSAPVRRQQQQQQQQEAEISSRGLSIGMRLDSLTPLSCSLFDVLGVTKETVLHLARLIPPTAITSTGSLPTLAAAYKSLLKHQVSRRGDLQSGGRSVAVQTPSRGIVSCCVLCAMSRSV